jgi:hypothetical protein
MDWVVLLTPVLLLAVVLLLGFAGCEFEHGALPPPTPTLTLRARVPSTLTVTTYLLTLTLPDGTSVPQPFPSPAASGTDGPDSLYDHTISEPSTGAWTVRCRVAVQEGSATDEDVTQGTFTLDGSIVSATATFQGSGSASAGNFNLVFTGVT